MIRKHLKVGVILSALAVSLAFPLATSTPLSAQDAGIQGLGLQERQVMERLRSSGLSAAQIRGLLSQQGYPLARENPTSRPWKRGVPPREA